jgi:transcriptional regulator with XRE-family HTH domain
VDEETRQVFVCIAERLGRIQRSQGISITDLARKSRIDESGVEAILRGEVDLQLHTVYQLAGALKVRPVRLLEGIEWIPDGPSGGHFRIGDPADR